MRFFDLISLIADNLNRRKGRVALTAIGVVIGTAAVIILVSLASGLQKSATSQLWGISDLSLIQVYPNYEMTEGVKMGGGGGGGGSTPTQANLLTPQALKDIAALPGVEQVIPRDYLYGQGVLKYGKLENYLQITGMDVKDMAVFNYPMSGGETTLERGTAIIGGYAAKYWYDPSARPGQEQPEPPDLLGQTVRLEIIKWTNDGQEVKKTVKLRIVGVIQEMRGEADSTLFVRMDELTGWNEWLSGVRINRNKDGYNNVIVKAADPEKVVELADQINALGYMAYTPQSYLESINQFFLILQVIFGGVGAVALLVAAIGIANTMTMAILERTREIGLMKAIGAGNRDVLSIFLGEAAGIGFLGGLGGVIIGWISSQALNVVASNYLASQAASGGGAPAQIALTTPLWLMGFGLIFATLVGLLSGLYPALRAATLMPVTALKYE